jgi:hypothetical protein
MGKKRKKHQTQQDTLEELKPKHEYQKKVFAHGKKYQTLGQWNAICLDGPLPHGGGYLFKHQRKGFQAVVRHNADGSPVYPDYSKSYTIVQD